MFKQIFVIAMAYFGVTVGAGFASGQEVLQYYVSYGVWGILGAVLALVVMPLSALIILQYGSYFRATSHGVVFGSVATKVTARFLDYSLLVAQFSISFTMLAGGGSNLNQQFGLPVWVGSALMAVMVLICGMLDVNKVTNIIGVFTPFMVIILAIAGFYAVSQAPGSFDSVNEYATTQVPNPLPNWWLSTFNYVGLCMFSGISMSIIIGGSNWNPRVAGWGGFVGGMLFAGLLMLLTFGLFFRVDTVGQADLPTLALINEIHPAFGVFSSVVIYLMIFATTLGVLYSSGKRFAPDEPGVSPRKYRIIFVILTLASFGLSFFDFTVLVNNVFPILGWLGVILIAVLVGTWAVRWRQRIHDETDVRTRVRHLVTKKLDPEEDFTGQDYAELVTIARTSSIDADELRDGVTEYVAEELELDATEDFELEQVWADARRPLIPGEVRVVSSAAPVGKEDSWKVAELPDTWNVEGHDLVGSEEDDDQQPS